MKQLKVTLRAQNNLLIERRKELGLTTSQMAEECGVSGATYGLYENLKTSPYRHEDCDKGLKWKETATKIAEFLGVDESELWPEEIIGIKTPCITRRVNVRECALLSSHSYAQAMLPDDVLYQRQLAENIEFALDTLTSRERKIIKESIMEDKPMTDIGAEEGVSHGRIGQIRDKALRRLRHSSRKKIILEGKNDTIPYTD